jgi:hypothetical protein
MFDANKFADMHALVEYTALLREQHEVSKQGLACKIVL